MGIDFDAGESAKCMCIVWFDFCFVILFIHKLKAWYSRYNWSISEWIPLKLEKLTRTNKDVTVRMITPLWLTGWALHLYLQLRLHGGLLQQQDSGLKGERELISSHTKFDFRRQKKMHKADFARDHFKKVVPVTVEMTDLTGVTKGNWLKGREESFSVHQNRWLIGQFCQSPVQVCLVQFRSKAKAQRPEPGA